MEWGGIETGLRDRRRSAESSLRERGDGRRAHDGRSARRATAVGACLRAMPWLKRVGCGSAMDCRAVERAAMAERTCVQDAFRATRRACHFTRQQRAYEITCSPSASITNWRRINQQSIWNRSLLVCTSFIFPNVVLDCPILLACCRPLSIQKLCIEIINGLSAQLDIIVQERYANHGTSA